MPDEQEPRRERVPPKTERQETERTGLDRPAKKTDPQKPGKEQPHLPPGAMGDWATL